MGPGTFYESVIDDKTLPAGSRDSIEKIIFTSGRHYFTLLDERKKRNLNNNIALVRIEELCPFPAKKIQGQSFPIQFHSGTSTHKSNN